MQEVHEQHIQVFTTWQYNLAATTYKVQEEIPLYQISPLGTAFPSDSELLAVPRFKTKHGEAAFSFYASRLPEVCLLFETMKTTITSQLNTCFPII